MISDTAKTKKNPTGENRLYWEGAFEKKKKKKDFLCFDRL